MEPLPGKTETPPESRSFLNGWSHFHWIMVAVLVWGGYLAIGVVQSPGNHSSIRGLIVFGFVLAFLAFWLAALAVRQRRLNREDEDET